jgi:hypothetical protein
MVSFLTKLPMFGKGFTKNLELFIDTHPDFVNDCTIY